MTDHRTIVRAAIRRVAPDVDPDEIADDVDFRADAGLDSMDFLNVLAAVSQATGVDVPERDYPSISTITTLAAYLDAQVPTA